MKRMGLFELHKLEFNGKILYCRRCLQHIAALFCLISPVFFSACQDAGNYVSITGYAQGGNYIVKLDLSDADTSAEALKASIDSILRVIDNSLSGYNKSSLVSRFNAGQALTDSSSAEYRLFKDMTDYSERLCEYTGGVVDVWSAPLFDVWGFGFTADSLPSPALIEEAKLASSLHKKLNFNAVAQGYSCDLIAEHLFSHGVKSMLVDIGGEIFCSGVNPRGNAWTIGVDSPVDGNMESGAQLKAIMEVPLGRAAVVTSGNYRKFYIKDGRKYAHTIDPRTGYPVQHNLLSATIVSTEKGEFPDALFADAMATYCMAIGVERAKEFILSEPAVEGLLIYDENGSYALWSSPGFKLKKEL